MFRPATITASLALGWALSPDVLVRLGNGAGAGGGVYLAALALAALLSALAALVIRHPALRGAARFGPLGLFSPGPGDLPLAALTLAVRLGTALLLSTGMLVSAGYTFNEVYLNWFPNFAFSFMLLAGILLLHLAGERAASAAQPVFILLTFACLLALLLRGASVATGAGAGAAWVGGAPWPHAALLGAPLLFLGYDRPLTGAADGQRPALAALLAAFLLLAAWGLVCLRTVAAPRLAGASLPHMLAAREIAGPAGRLLMGGAVIVGAAGAVNALLLAAAEALVGLARRRVRPVSARRGPAMRLCALLIAGMVALLMAGGLAGHEVLESGIQAVLLLWLLHVGLRSLDAGRALVRSRRSGRLQAGLAFGLGLLLCVWALTAAAIDPQAAVIARFWGALFLASLLLSVVLARVGAGRAETTSP
jgi:hypothetical protein